MAPTVTGGGMSPWLLCGWKWREILHLRGHNNKGLFPRLWLCFNYLPIFSDCSLLPAWRYLCTGSRSLQSIKYPTCGPMRGHYRAQCWRDCFWIAEWFYLRVFHSVVGGREDCPANPEQVNKPGWGNLFEISGHPLPTVSLFWTHEIIAYKFLQYTLFHLWIFRTLYSLNP